MSLKECTVSMVGQDGRMYETTVEAASLFDAAGRAIRQGARPWWYRPGAVVEVRMDSVLNSAAGWAELGSGVTSLAGFAGGALPQAPGGRTWMPLKTLLMLTEGIGPRVEVKVPSDVYHWPVLK
jgi:hypothetical protein